MSTVARRLGRVIPLPNIKLRLNPPRYASPADASLGVDEVVFVTTPDVTKLEVRNFLETVHDIRVVELRGQEEARSRWVSPPGGYEEGVRDAARAVVPAERVCAQASGRLGR
jgi:hypothetical protein